MDSIDKRESVKKDYNLIANQYFEEFGTIIEELFFKYDSNTLTNSISSITVPNSSKYWLAIKL